MYYTSIFLSNFYFNVAHQLQCLRANQVTGMGSIVTFQNGIPVPFFPRPTVSITVTITFTYNESKNRITTKLLTHFCILLFNFHSIYFPPISTFYKHLCAAVFHWSYEFNRDVSKWNTGAVMNMTHSKSYTCTCTMITILICSFGTEEKEF